MTEYTVALIDASGENKSVDRKKNFSKRTKALSAMRGLSQFVNFDGGEWVHFGEREKSEEWFETFEDSDDSEYWVPDVNEEVYDTESPDWSDGKLRVTSVTDTPARDYTIETEVRGQPVKSTVAAQNLTHPDNAPVVKGRYISEDGRESPKVYAFPATRLKVDSP